MAILWSLNALLYVYSAILALQAVALTDESDVKGLQYFYRTIRSTKQLKNWKLEGGDPCGESWTGVQCVGSSITHLKLHGLGLSGIIQLNHLKTLKQLDLSSNSFKGSIPYEIPHDVTHVNLARNNFTNDIPLSFYHLKNLQYLNLSYNSLSGILRKKLSDLKNLSEMDLSFSYLTGELPTSFTSLKTVTRLFLQHNGFDGAVTCLANLPLRELNIEHNHFNGVIPIGFQRIRNLRLEGNNFEKGTNYSPSSFVPSALSEHNISDPTTNLNDTKSHSSQFTLKQDDRSSVVGIILLVGGVVLSVICAFFVISFYRRKSSWRRLKSKNSDDSDTSLHVLSIRETT